MSTVVLGERPLELAALLRPAAQRADLVMTGPFNLGTPDDYRVPGRGWHQVRSAGTWLPTAAVVVEVVSPGDQSYEKHDFYAAHAVDEILTADPGLRTVRLWSLRGGAYEEVSRSVLLDLDADDLVARIDWP